MSLGHLAIYAAILTILALPLVLAAVVIRWVVRRSRSRP